MDGIFGLNLLGYIDPGTGSLVIQVLAATLLSAGLFFKGLRERIGMLFSGLFGSKKSAEATSDSETMVAGEISHGTTQAHRKAA